MLAKQIMILIKASGMSQSQLAKQLNVGPSAVGMYEQGRRTPAVDILIEMANLFEVSLDYLITGKEAPSERTDKKAAVDQFTCPCRACCIYCKKCI